MQRQARGFTLLEVLVAISIFALIGLASYRVLSSVIQADERLAARNTELRTVNRAFWLMQQDIEQLVQRPVRGADGAAQSYLEVNSGEMPLLFTRAGRANPLGLPRSSMQRVAYRVDHHPDYDQPDSPHYREDRWYLLRYTWLELDGSGDREKALTQVLLPDIEKLVVNVFTENGLETEWPPALQPGQTAPEPPLALQLELTHTQWGAIRRSFKVL
jgi:general secretion pathway protein J